MQQLLTRYADQRFGMFIHYNMNTYYGGWAENRVDPKTFAPPNVDCHTFTDQWAAAAKAAGMKFGLLTTKHHDGFAIWPSKATPPASSPYGTTPYTIAQSTVPTMDVVKCYVDSFRAQGLDPDLYFSIWDPNNGIGSQSGHNTDPGAIDWAVVGPYITAQITELLTNYGDIPLFVFDGYAWLTGHQQVPYQQIRALVRKLQPNTIVMDHNGGVPSEVDTEYFEEPLGVRVPTGNVTVGSQGQTVAKNGNWFWDSGQAGSGYLSAADIAAELKTTEPNYTNFILDCPPNPQGKLDSAIVTILGQVPSSWTPNVSRAALPAQPQKIEIPITAVSATATSGSAAPAIDGYNDGPAGINNTLHGTGHGESLWKSTGSLPQSVTINLGKSYDNIDMLEYLPQRHTGTTAGNITSYKIYVSTDNTTFTQVATGTWPADPSYHGLISPQRAEFAPQTAQYVRLEATAVAGGGTSAIIGEVAVGSSGAIAVPGSGGASGSGGAGGGGTNASGGTIGAGGISSGGTGGAGGGGTNASGGTIGAGGISSGGTGGAGLGGSNAGGSGGRLGIGGTVSTNGGAGGLGGAAGAASQGGASAQTGGTQVTGGTTPAGSGGVANLRGNSSSGGDTSHTASGSSGTAASGGGASGCGCSIGGKPRQWNELVLVALGAIGFLVRRRLKIAGETSMRCRSARWEIGTRSVRKLVAGHGGELMNEAETTASTDAAAGVHVFTGKLHRVQRGHGRAFVDAPPAPSAEPVRRPARVAIMLALAHKIQDAIDRGAVRDCAEVATRLGLSMARISQLLDLSLLAPDIQEQILLAESVDGV
jgi:alpha-L-fucosidase